MNLFPLLRPLLFQLDPEKAHHLALHSLNFLYQRGLLRFLVGKVPQLPTTLCGMQLPNPVGLAAGLDKDGRFIDALATLGFGFLEIGTVTPLPQSGNPKPRMFRLPKTFGIINRMGFNNDGLEIAIQQLKKNKGKLIIGGNIGKNTQTSSENYTTDYELCFKGLYPFVDYFVLNVSCPNVGSHAKLNDKSYLIELISAIQKLNNQEIIQKPILLKIAPDLNNNQLDEIIELVAETKIDGVIASNTSTTRDHLKTSNHLLKEIGNGGLSGQPIKELSTKVIKYLAQNSNKAFPIIGVGGIHSAEDALEKIEAGADLVQIYTGFIYEGPGLIKKINKALLTH
mgnify:CR=1 FL=1